LSSIWFIKLFQVQDKLEARDRTNTDIFVIYQTTTQLFVSRTSCLIYQNSISSPKNHIKQKNYSMLLKFVMCCSALCCVVLSYTVLSSTYCFANQTQPWSHPVLMQFKLVLALSIYAFYFLITLLFKLCIIYAFYLHFIFLVNFISCSLLSAFYISS